MQEESVITLFIYYVFSADGVCGSKQREKGKALSVALLHPSHSLRDGKYLEPSPLFTSDTYLADLG
eukprot:scaffold9825_cov116-Skeletonema_marinoi.AAC.2